MVFLVIVKNRLCKYTIAKWLTPNGTWINQKGLKPTYPVPESALAKLPQFQSMSILKKSMTGVDVATLQQYLTALGYMPKHVTGVFDDETKNELLKIRGNDEEIKDRFYKSLDFGTAGLRGVIGAGTNRMNVYTVSKATQGFANYLNKSFESPKVAIAYLSLIHI